MSKTWWGSVHTTQGHGIFSQYKADHQKDWIYKENRKYDRQHSSEKSFSDADSFYRNSLHSPHNAPPLENLHHAYPKSLKELKELQKGPQSEADQRAHTMTMPRSPSEVVRQPLPGRYLPHLAHHHHFGWNPPTPEDRIAIVDSHHNHHKYGNAMTYNQVVHSKHAMITTRKP